MPVNSLVLTSVLALSAVSAVFVALGVLAWRRSRLQKPEAHAPFPLPCPPQVYTTDETARPAGPVVWETFERSGPSAATSWRYEDQPALWREALAVLGMRLETWGVVHIALVHGTFMGDDPFSIAGTVRALVPGLRPETEHAVSKLARSASRQVLRDHGNFLAEYAELLGRGLASSIRVERFSWSAGNYHLARLEAAIELTRYLDTSLGRLSQETPARVLLVGHSHAGQVFALLVQMLAEVEHVPELFAVAEESGADIPLLRERLGRLRSFGLDVVTLGTPPRYGWPLWPGYRLLHIINHRGSAPTAGSIRGLLHTTDGDYIQQWGIAGSDLPAADAKARKLNLRLDAILGVGADTKAWRGHVRAKVRVPAYGKTLLVDYRDGNRLKPNAVDTFFGHAVYTRKRVMLFNFELIAEHLYPALPSEIVEARGGALVRWLRSRVRLRHSARAG